MLLSLLPIILSFLDFGHKLFILLAHSPTRFLSFSYNVFLACRIFLYSLLARLPPTHMTNQCATPFYSTSRVLLPFMACAKYLSAALNFHL